MFNNFFFFKFYNPADPKLLEADYRQLQLTTTTRATLATASSSSRTTTQSTVSTTSSTTAGSSRPTQQKKQTLKKLVQANKKEQQVERRVLKKILLVAWKQNVEESSRMMPGPSPPVARPVQAMAVAVPTGGSAATDDCAIADPVSVSDPDELNVTTPVSCVNVVPSGSAPLPFRDINVQEESVVDLGLPVPDDPDGDQGNIQQQCSASVSDENGAPPLNSKGYPTVAQKVPRSIFRRDQSHQTAQPQHPPCQRCEVLEAKIKMLEEQLAWKGKDVFLINIEK